MRGARPAAAHNDDQRRRQRQFWRALHAIARPFWRFWRRDLREWREKSAVLAAPTMKSAESAHLLGSFVYILCISTLMLTRRHSPPRRPLPTITSGAGGGWGHAAEPPSTGFAGPPLTLRSLRDDCASSAWRVAVRVVLVRKSGLLRPPRSPKRHGKPNAIGAGSSQGARSAREAVALTASRDDGIRPRPSAQDPRALTRRSPDHRRSPSDSCQTFQLMG